MSQIPRHIDGIQIIWDFDILFITQMLKVYSPWTPYCTALIDFKYSYRLFTNSAINTITII